MKAPATSVEAIPAPKDIEAAQVVIVRDVLKNGPATSAEIADRIKVSAYAASKRCSELIAGGMLLRINRRRNPGTGKWASVLAATDQAQDFVDGYAELAPPPHKTRRDHLGRVLKASRDVSSAGKPDGKGGVVVPMDLMVDLSVALTRLDETRLVPR